MRETAVGSVFQVMGYLSVAIFFFLSGYGLQISGKKDKYIPHMPYRRILPFYVNCVILVIVYVLFKYFLHHSFSIVSILKSLTWGGTVITNGWYLQAMLVLYVVFWLVNLFVKEAKTEILLIFILLICYCFICNFAKMHSTAYESIFAFVFGCVWYEKKQGIDNILNKHWKSITAAVFLSFSATLLLGHKILLFKMVSAILFVVLVNALLIKIPIRCKFSEFTGRYYFEIYVTQGLTMSLFHSSYIYITNAWLYILFCSVTTVGLSLILHPLFQATNALIKKFEIGGRL